MSKKIKQQAISIILSLFFCITLALGIVHFPNSSNATEDDVVVYAIDSIDPDATYLSDIQHDASKSKVGSGKLTFNKTDAGANISVKIEGAWYSFPKGIYAHGPSYVAFDIREYSEKYQYLTTFVGLLSTATKSDGALVYIQFSEDGTNWVTQPISDTSVNPDNIGRQLVKYNQNALYFTLNITGVKWIRLVADKNGSNAQDYVVWADAKLTNTLDDVDGGRSLASYDKEIKEKLGEDVDFDAIKNDEKVDLFKDEDLELLVLQREFVSRVGQYALKRFRSESADNITMLDGWLLKDLDSLREFMLGGTPYAGSYYNSLTVLSDLYKYYKKDLDDGTLLGYNHTGNTWMPNRTFGELCRTMMFAVALTHDGTIGSYLQGSKPENRSYPLQRYAIFKYMYQTERFVSTRNADKSWKSETMSWFESYRVEEMRWLMCNIIDDESILWLNDQVQTRINTNPNNVSKFLDPYTYVKYTTPNYNNPVFYADENHEYFNNQFAVDYRGDNAGENWSGSGRVGMFDTKYIVPAGEGQDPYVITISYSKQGETKLQKVWMNFSNKFGTGSVCGGISKSGTNIRTVRGIPANVIGQPGHAAILYYSKDAKGNGSWKIDNDVGGWLAATKGERHLLGWGNASWQRNSGGTVVYFHLAQACLNDYDNLVKAEEYIWLAKVYSGESNLKKQEALYEKALSIQPLNLDAWYGLVTTYKADKTKTASDFSTLAKRIGDTYYNHPVAMHCLFKLFRVTTGIAEVDAALTNPVFTMQLKTIEINTLAETKKSGSVAAKSKVSYLLGNVDLSVADFSFDGENAGCIVWASSFDSSEFTWKYSLDGKQTWSEEIKFKANEPHIHELLGKELEDVSAENDIYVCIVGADEGNAYRIDLSSKPTLPNTLYANDWENKIIGVDSTYEWRYCTKTEKETETGAEVTYTPISNWVSYAEASPDCSGDKIIEVRLKATAKNLASDGRIFTFTTDTDTAERKYISVDHLTLVDYSTQSMDSKRPNYAINAIDGNGNTYWHTDYDINIKMSTKTVGKDQISIPELAPYLTIKLDAPRFLSGLEFVQYQYNVGFSIFAKNVTVYVSEDGENWKEAGKRENFENIDDLKVVYFAESVYGQYVKLVMDDLYETNTSDGVFTTVSMINLYEDTTIAKHSDKTESPKSNKGLRIATLVICGILVVGTFGYILYLRKKSKDNDKKNTGKGGKPKANNTKSKTTKQKASDTKIKTSTAKQKANVAKSQTGVIKQKASETKPKVNTTSSKASSAKPKVNVNSSTAKSKVVVTKPQTSAVKPKESGTKTKVNSAKSKPSTTKSSINNTKQKTSTTKLNINNIKPKAKDIKPKTSSAKPKVSSAAKSKIGATKPKVSNTNSKTSSAKSKTNTTKQKVDTTKIKPSNTKLKPSTTKKKVSDTKTKPSATKQNVGGTKTKTSTAKQKVSGTKIKTSTTKSKVNTAKPKK